MSARAAKIYAENNAHTSVVSANSGQLIVLVFERIFDHLKVGKLALENGQYAIDSFAKAHDLIQQGLLVCLDYEAGVDVAKNLGAIMSGPYAKLLMLGQVSPPRKFKLLSMY